MTYAPAKFSVCTPVWQVGANNFAETAAFNAELYDGPSSRPLVMNAGDTIRIHFYVASTAEGWHVQNSRSYYVYKSQEELTAWNNLFLPITQGS